MRAILDPFHRLTPGPLLLAGLALFVLGVMARLISATGFTALTGAAVAAWLLALAVWALERTAGRSDRDRYFAFVVPAALAVVLAVVSAASAAQFVGLLPSGGAPAALAEQVAGVTATPSAAATLPVIETLPPLPSDSLSPSPTDTPTDSASGAPTESPPPTDSPGPSDTPTPPPPATGHHGPVHIASIDITSPVNRGDTASVTVHTDPFVTCSIRVRYPGASSADGLSPTAADGSGLASWTWQVSPSTPTGTWSVRVTCSSGVWSTWQTVHLRVV